MVEMTTDRFAFFTNTHIGYPGQLTTKPITIPQNRDCVLTANADTTIQGVHDGSNSGNASAPTLRIELLSASGYRLHGFDAASARIITGVSGVSIPASWSAVPPGPPPGPKPQTSCHENVKDCATMQPEGEWMPWPCKTNADCAHVGTMPVSCDGQKAVCLTRNHTCFSEPYKAPLCVKKGSVQPPPPPPAPPSPPSSKLPSSTNHQLMIRAHLSGGAQLYAMSLVCQ